MVRYSIRLQLSSVSQTHTESDVVKLVSAMNGVETESVVIYVSKTHPQDVSLSFKIFSQEIDTILLDRLGNELRSLLMQPLSLSVARG